MSIHEQARAEAEKRYPLTPTGKGFAVRVAYERGFLAGHEAATRTREWSSIDPPPGWFTFGTHVEHDGPLEFSEAVGDDLMPLWERPATHPRVVTTVTELNARYALVWDYEGNTFDAVHDSLESLVDHARALLTDGVTTARMEVLR